MTVKDLLQNRDDVFHSQLFTGRLVAKDGSSGKEVFDTFKNKPDYVKKFFPCEIEKMWCDGKIRPDNAFNEGWWMPVLMIYLKGDEINECKRQNS